LPNSKANTGVRKVRELKLVRLPLKNFIEKIQSRDIKIGGEEDW
jgi:hypothetical protein